MLKQQTLRVHYNIYETKTLMKSELKIQFSEKNFDEK